MNIAHKICDFEYSEYPKVKMCPQVLEENGAIPIYRVEDNVSVLLDGDNKTACDGIGSIYLLDNTEEDFEINGEQIYIAEFNLIAKECVSVSGRWAIRSERDEALCVPQRPFGRYEETFTVYYFENDFFIVYKENKCLGQ